MSEEKKNTPIAAEESTPEAPKKSNKKKLIIMIACAAVVVIAAVVLTIVLTSGGGNTAADEEIEYVDVIANNYYSGVVEPQQTSEIAKDSERTVKDIYVKVGDTVKKGDKLFSYDTEETSNLLSKAKIEYDSIQNEITEYDNNISILSRQRSEADESQQLEYTTQIQEQEANKSQAQLNLKIKQVQINNYQDNLDNSVITSPIDGIIKQVNSSSDGSSNAFITILMNSSYRVKGKVDETNVGGLEVGMSVIIHSRIDDEKTWEGTISEIDTSDTADSGNNDMMYGNQESDSASKYYFYVSLESSEDLLMGEHVFIEPIYESAEGDDTEAEAAELADTTDTADAPAADVAEN